MKVLFLTPPFGAWATHGDHKAPNQYYAQVAAYLREKKAADVCVLDAKALALSPEEMMEKIKQHLGSSGKLAKKSSWPGIAKN